MGRSYARYLSTYFPRPILKYINLLLVIFIVPSLKFYFSLKIFCKKTINELDKSIINPVDTDNFPIDKNITNPMSM